MSRISSGRPRRLVATLAGLALLLVGLGAGSGLTGQPWSSSLWSSSLSSASQPESSHALHGLSAQEFATPVTMGSGPASGPVAKQQRTRGEVTFALPVAGLSIALLVAVAGAAVRPPRPDPTARQSGSIRGPPGRASQRSATAH